MSADVSVRPARTEDLPQLLAFEQAIIAAERPFDPTLRPEGIHYYDLGELLASSEARLLVAESSGRLVGSGFAQLRPSKSYLSHTRYAYLGFMYVVPEWRGQGVNARILHELIAWARGRGVTEVQLEVYAGNAAAVRAYEKVGFVSNLVEMRLATKD